MERIRSKIIPFLLLLLVLTGCGVKKKAVQPSAPKWHTCLIKGVKATIAIDDNQLSASVTTQIVRDSMIIISIVPMLGMEMIRIEATPTEIIGIDKVHGFYARATYATLNRIMRPSLNWDMLQLICSAGVLPEASNEILYTFAYGEKEVVLRLEYPGKQLDAPVRMTRQRLDKYTAIDISKWL